MTSPTGRRRSVITSLVFLLALAVVAVLARGPLVAWFSGEHAGAGPSVASSAHATNDAAGPNEIDHYTCSMHPSVRQNDPGKCPICGMDLVPVTRAQQEQGVVFIDAARRQLIGVRTEIVSRGPMRSAFRAVGQVTYDESGFTDVNLKVRGWISKLAVNRTGQRVQQGQTLFTLYSPELYNAEQDFLLATSSAARASARDDGGLSSSNAAAERPSLVRAARTRLHLLGLSDAQIAAVVSAGAPSESVAFTAPASGFIVEKNVVEGASIDAGTRVYRIAALDRVWIEADVYEAEFSRVHAGQPAHVTLDYAQGRAFDAKVNYVYPYLDPKARTGRVRIELTNRDLELRPGMYASVELGSALGERLQVPAAGVVYTGTRRLVFVDLGEGHFKPVEVSVGIESDGKYEVLSGLSAGDLVAVSGVFLIAAEARISTAAKYWDREATDAGVSAAGASPSPTAADAPTASAFSCPMHPEVQRSAPGKCPKCGMDLVPRKVER